MPAELISKNYTVNDVEIHTEEREGKAPVLILLHGVSMSGQVWNKQLQSDILKDYHMISVELPGHGASARATEPDKQYTLPGYTYMLKDLIPQLTDEKYILVGYSLGGNVAIEALPELQKCIGLMAINSAIVSKPPRITDAFQNNPALGTIFKEDPDENELRDYTDAFFAPRNVNTKNTLAQDFKRTDPKARTILDQSLKDGNYEDEVEILKKGTLPVALVTGQEDRLGDNTYLRDLDVPKWNDTSIEVPNAGHIPQLENSRFFDKALLDFIEHCQAQNR